MDDQLKAALYPTYRAVFEATGVIPIPDDAIQQAIDTLLIARGLAPFDKQTPFAVLPNGEALLLAGYLGPITEALKIAATIASRLEAEPITPQQIGEQMLALGIGSR